MLPAGPLTFGQAVADDRDERLPLASLDSLHEWGYSAYQVPETAGGRLTSLDELVGLGRVVARRDPTVAIIANAPVAAAMPVWLAGTPAQQRSVARAVLDGQRVALGLTERDHGADLLSSEVTGRVADDGYVLNGSKWLINNVRLARFLCVLVRDPDRTGFRSLSLLLVDLDELAPESYELLPKIPTHGVCGADIAGIRFTDGVVPLSACIGRPGRGLELTAQSLVVTRSLVPGLSLGVLETALHGTLDFVRERRLYGGVAADIAFVQDELAAAYLDLAVGEVVADCCVRILHMLPELAPISSAVAKYVVPHLAETRMRGLATVLGARYFLREDHWFGIFEKLLRDVRLFSLFDGSEPVVLSALAAHASCLAEPDTDPRLADAVFRQGTRTFDRPFGTAAFETVADEDPVTAGLAEVRAALERRSADNSDLRAAAELLRATGDDVRARALRDRDPRSLEGQRLGARYARLFAGICLARVWLGPLDADAPVVPASWLAAGLTALLAPTVRMPRATSRSLFDELTRQYREQPRTRCLAEV